jgi:ankyrin repeat protein
MDLDPEYEGEQFVSNKQYYRNMVNRGLNPLCEIILERDPDLDQLIDIILSRINNINRVMCRGYHLLHVAVFYNNSDLLLKLLNNGADPNVKVAGRTPLQFAIMHNYHGIVRDEIVEILLPITAINYDDVPERFRYLIYGGKRAGNIASYGRRRRRN